MKSKTGPLILLLLFIFHVNLYSQVNNSISNKEMLKNMITNFQNSIIQKDSVTFKTLFFDKNTPIIGIMSPLTELSIKKNNPQFEGISVSNSSRFIKEICSSPHQQEEKFHNIKIESDTLLATVSFDYIFKSNGNIIQWGEEKWSLVFAENNWFITGINFTIRFPKVEPSPTE